MIGSLDVFSLLAQKNTSLSFRAILILYLSPFHSLFLSHTLSVSVVYIFIHVYILRGTAGH